MLNLKSRNSLGSIGIHATFHFWYQVELTLSSGLSAGLLRLFPAQYRHHPQWLKRGSLMKQIRERRNN